MCDATGCTRATRARTYNVHVELLSCILPRAHFTLCKNLRWRGHRGIRRGEGEGGEVDRDKHLSPARHLRQLLFFLLFLFLYLYLSLPLFPSSSSSFSSSSLFSSRPFSFFYYFAHASFFLFSHRSLPYCFWHLLFPSPLDRKLLFFLKHQRTVEKKSFESITRTLNE